MIKAKLPLFHTDNLKESPDEIQLWVRSYILKNVSNLISNEPCVKTTSIYTDHLIYKVTNRGNSFVFLTNKKNEVMSQSVFNSKAKAQDAYLALANKVELELVAKGRL